MFDMMGWRVVPGTVIGSSAGEREDSTWVRKLMDPVKAKVQMTFSQGPHWDWRLEEQCSPVAKSMASAVRLPAF